MNKETTLRQTIQLWNALARNPGAQKADIPGPWHKYFFECPCCEYAEEGVGKTNCNICPMLKQWTCFGGLIKSAFCCSEHSPYWRWAEETELFTNRKCRRGGVFLALGVEDYRLRPSKYDIEFFCLLIVELAEEALSELPDSAT